MVADTSVHYTHVRAICAVSELVPLAKIVKTMTWGPLLIEVAAWDEVLL
jgi:hypothetical protein